MNGSSSGKPAVGVLAYAYLAASIALCAPSYLAWSRSPFPYTINEFDPWLGLHTNTTIARIAHTLLFVVVGLLYVAIARRDEQTPRWLVPASWLVFLAAVPSISIDVFFYLAKGWLEFKYNANPYTVVISSLPAHGADPIFQSMVPVWQSTLGNYGPVFQKISTTIAAASGGSPIVGLVLFKLLSAACLILCRYPLRKIACLLGTPVRVIDRWLLLNPLVLYCFLSAAHNDTLLMLAVLLGVLCVMQRRYWLAGLWIGFSIGLKTVGVFLLPVLLVYLILDRTSRGALAPAIKGVTGLFLGLLPPFALYSHSLETTLAYIGGYAQGVRSSVYVLLDPIAVALGAHGSLSPITLGRVTFILVASWRLLKHARINGSNANRFLVVSCFEIIVLAQLLTIPMMNEWYLLWPICFALVVNDSASRGWIAELSVAYMPVVVWAIRGEARIVLLAQLIILSALLISAANYFVERRSLDRAIRSH